MNFPTPTLDELGAEARLGTVEVACYMAVLIWATYLLQQLGYEPLGVGAVSGTVATFLTMYLSKWLRSRDWGADR